MKMLAPPKCFLPEVQQAIFRRLLEATAYPGESQDLSDFVEDTKTAVAVLATLIDDEVSYADPNDLITGYEHGFITGRAVDAKDADYIVADVSQPRAFEAKIGTIYRPETAATVILQADGAGLKVRLEGPGIKEPRTIGLAEELRPWLEWRNSLILYPQGIDLLVCNKAEVIALPRTTQVRIES